jgi:hypothetical protein
MKKVTDIDIDFADRDHALSFIPHTPASMLVKDELKRHNVGVYLHEVPIDPITETCSIPYKQAENHGFFKMDFLNVHVYSGIETPTQLESLMATEPVWDLLLAEDVVDQLFHLSGHFDVVNRMKPKSVMQLAMVLAMIRPAKRHLIGKSWDEIEAEIWTPTEEDLYQFKKSHAIAYSLVITVQMNRLVTEVVTANAS